MCVCVCVSVSLCIKTSRCDNLGYKTCTSYSKESGDKDMMLYPIQKDNLHTHIATHTHTQTLHTSAMNRHANLYRCWNNRGDYGAAVSHSNC